MCKIFLFLFYPEHQSFLHKLVLSPIRTETLSIHHSQFRLYAYTNHLQNVIKIPQCLVDVWRRLLGVGGSPEYLHQHISNYSCLEYSLVKNHHLYQLPPTQLYSCLEPKSCNQTLIKLIKASSEQIIGFSVFNRFTRSSYLTNIMSLDMYVPQDFGNKV